MPVSLDLITHKNLILIKQIYQRAVVQSASLHSDADRILSLISFDLANETLLKNAITAVDSRAEIVSNLKTLIKTANDVFSKAAPPIAPVPDAQKVRRVRDIRNGAMHEAKYPTTADINDCRTYTRDFLQQLVSNVWDQDFSSIRLTDAIRHPEVKGFLVKADDRLNAGNYTDAVVQAKAGLELAIGKVKSSIVGRMPRDVDSLVVAKGKEFQPSRDMFDAFQTMRDAVVRAAIGLEYSSYKHYHRLTEHIFTAYFGEGKIQAAISGRAPEAEDAEYVVNYAINAVIQIESLAGDMDKPFGEDRQWLH